MEIKKKSWDDITLSEYRKICNIVEEKTMDEASKNVACLAILCECSEEEIWDLPMYELGSLTSEIGWAKHFDFKARRRLPHHLNIGGEMYDVVPDLQRITVAAYVDFQAYCEHRRENMGLILTCFVYPKGKKYAEGYDVRELAEKFEDNVSITLWNDIAFFLTANWLSFIRASQIYLTSIIDKMTPQEREALTESLKDKGIPLSSTTLW